MITREDTERARVLVVDDESEVLELLSRFLAGKRYRVQVARSGEEALQFLERQRADLVLLDIYMPGLGGLETLRKIRTLKPAPPVVVISGTHDVDLAKSMFAQGAVEYVMKPVDFYYLETCLHHVLLSGSS